MVLVCTIGLLGTAITPAAAQATFSLGSSAELTLDSNKPCTTGPHAGYVHFKIQNSGSTAWAAPKAVATGFANGIDLAGGQRPEIYFPPTPPGGVVDAFWYIQYPCTIGTTATPTVTMYDGTSVVGSTSTTFTTTAMLSSQAGGNLVAQTLTAVNLGAITYLQVGYQFGGPGTGATLLVEPAGTTDFNAGCFQLLGDEVLSSDLQAIPVGSTNQIQWTAATGQGGSKFQVQVRYTFRALCANTSTIAKPFANEFGGGKLKYSANFDSWGSSGETTVPGAANPFTMSKTVTPDTLHDGGPVTYTITVRNPSAYDSMIDSIVDVLPSGVTYAGLDATSRGVSAATSTSIPAAGATGRIVWHSVPGVYYPVAAGDSLVVVYHANVPPPEGTYTNAASSYVAVTMAGSAATNVIVRRIADVSVTKTGPTSALVGDTVRYVLTVQNAGPSAARTVTLTDTMPAQLTLLRATRGGAVSGGVVSWPAIDSMPPNTTVTDTVIAQVIDTGTVINIAATQSPRLDPDSTNQDGRNPAGRITIQLAPPVIQVAVTPDGGAPTARLAGTGYGQPFTVASTSARWETFDLLLRTQTTGPGGAVVDSITGAGAPSVVGDSLRITVPDSTTQVLTVWYTVPTGDTTTTRFVVMARATRDSAARDTAWAAVERGAPELVVTKTVSPQTAPAPGTDLTYTSTVQNVGDFAAHNTVVEDDVPPAVVFKVGSVTTTLPAGVTGLVTYSDDGGATWSYTPVSGGCGAPAGYDACVRRIRVSLSADLPSGSSSTGQVEFVARIR